MNWQLFDAQSKKNTNKSHTSAMAEKPQLGIVGREIERNREGSGSLRIFLLLVFVVPTSIRPENFVEII